MTYRWLVTDLDGTLVDRRLRMVPRSRAALGRFRASGGEVVIATGRSRESAAPYYAELGLTGPAILLNGALVCNLATGEVLLDRRLPGEVWAEAKTLLGTITGSSDGDAAGVVFLGGQAYRVADSPLIDAYAARDGVTVLPVASWDDLPAAEISKVMVICATTSVAKDITGKVAALDVTTVVSEPTYVELLPCGVHKGTALTLLAARCGVPLDQVAAIGDNPNDIPMLRVAGLGAAVGDGHPATHAAADAIVGDCDRGAVADVVDLILGPARDDEVS